MTISITNFYRSSNGDQWQLIRADEPPSMLVRHIANPSAGGHTTENTVEDFLSIDGPGPEFSALRHLLDKNLD